MDVVEVGEHDVISKRPWLDASYLALSTRTTERNKGFSNDESRALEAKVDALVERPENVYR